MTDELFEREKLCYEQNYEHARSLNDQMNRVPVLSVTLTGGLWFGAGLTDNVDQEIRFALLLFAGLSNIALVLVSLRIRDVLQSYLEKIKAFHVDGFATGRPAKPKLGRFGGYSMITTFCFLMLAAALLSFIGAFAFYWPASFHISAWWGVVILAAALTVAVWLLLREQKAT